MKRKIYLSFFILCLFLLIISKNVTQSFCFRQRSRRLPRPKFFIGRRIDVYTHYPAPYGGQGVNMSSDAFAPQELVILFANVTYIGMPPQNDLVIFEMRSPKGDFDAYRSVYTNDNCVANVSFRIPAVPIVQEEKVIGTWNVTAYVPLNGDINGDKIVDIFDLVLVCNSYGSQPGDSNWDHRCDLNKDDIVDIYDLVMVATNYGQTFAIDVVSLKVGWIVELLELETCDEAGNLKTDFAKGERVYFNITLQNISMKDKNATVVISVFDVLEDVIGTTMHNLVVPSEAIIELLVENIIIPQTAFIGEATAYANTYNAPPAQDGEIYCPEVLVTFRVTKAI